MDSLMIMNVFNIDFLQQRMKTPVYVVKPKNIFKHPFNKFDLDKPTTRETQNEDLTDYFNFGFNEDTMNIYGKLVKRSIETLDQSINPDYFDAPSQLMRLNDEIPMDFGGFCKFFDRSIFLDTDDNEEGLQNMENFHNGDELFEYLIYLVMRMKPEYPLIEFVRSLYCVEGSDEGQITDIMNQIQKNLERKYKDMMERLYVKKNATVPVTNKHSQNKQRNQKAKSEQSNKDSSSSEEDKSSTPESSVYDSESSQQSIKKKESRSRKSESRSRAKDRSRSREKRHKKHIKKDSKKRDKKDKRDKRDKKKRKDRDRSRDRHHKHSKSERRDKHKKRRS